MHSVTSCEHCTARNISQYVVSCCALPRRLLTYAWQPAVAVRLLAIALHRLDPTGRAFTSHHLPAVQLAYKHNAVDHILPTINKTIVFYPGMRGKAESRPLCDMSLPPSSYITIESGLTARVSPSMVLEYDFCIGLIHLRRRAYLAALQAFERVLTHPSKDHGCSRIMVEAHNKWVLTSLLTKGKVETPASLSQSVGAAYTKVGQPYLTVAAAFIKPDNAVELRNAIDTVGMQVWAEEGNEGLIREVQAHYQRHHILRLSDIYTKLSLEDIRTLTQSAETGGRLETAGQVEELLDYMTSTSMLKGVITKPPGSAPADGQGYLTFLQNEEMDEQAFADEMFRVRDEIKLLRETFFATEERLTTSIEYLKHLVKNENSAKTGGARDVSYDSQVEDEDLMGAS